MWALITGLFVLAFWAAVILGILGFLSYNKLRPLFEEVKKRSSNIETAQKRLAEELNRSMNTVQGLVGHEQLMQLKVSQDNLATGMMQAYQQSSTMMATLQGAADRFPQLKADGAFTKHQDAISRLHADVQQKMEQFNDAVSAYNVVCGKLPAALFVGFLGFKKEEYLHFEASGETGFIPAVREFKTDEGERLQELLHGAGSHIMGATKVIAAQAGQAGKLIAEQAGQAGKLVAEKMKERSVEHAAAAPLSQGGAQKYFYMQTGGVPKGPASMSEIQTLVSQGFLQKDAMIAEVGSQEWKALGASSSEAIREPE